MTKITLKQALDLCTTGNPDTDILLKAEKDPEWIAWGTPWLEYTISRAQEELDLDKTLVYSIGYMTGSVCFVVEALVPIAE